MALKRVNFNMAPDCHRLLKATCAILDVSVSEFCSECIHERFRELCKSDERFLTLLLADDYKEGSDAYLLKEQFKKYLLDRSSPV